MISTTSYEKLFRTVTGQHGIVHTLFGDISDLTGLARQTRLDDLRAYLAAHEAWEQGWIHPLVSRQLDEGYGHPGDVDNRLVEERDAGLVLDRLRDELTVDSPTFDVQFALLKEAVTHHAQDEEEREIPLLDTGHSHELSKGVARAVWVGDCVARVAEQIRPMAREASFVHAIGLASGGLADEAGLAVAR